MPNPRRVFFLAASYNRANKTVSSFRSLRALADSLSLNAIFCLVDNNSADNTVNLVRDSNPSVFIVKTPHNMYWAESMNFGWAALCRVFEVQGSDMIFAFNDDIKINNNSVVQLQAAINFLSDDLDERQPAAVVFSFLQKEGIDFSFSYGGLIRSRTSPFLRLKHYQPKRVIQDIEFVQVDTFNMNAVLFRAETLLKNSFLATYFRHGGADYELGLRLSRNHLNIYALNQYFGICQRNKLPLIEFLRFDQLILFYSSEFSPKSLPISARFCYYFSSIGLMAFPQILLYYLSPLLKTLLPIRF